LKRKLYLDKIIHLIGKNHSSLDIF
jgi:hypothetical protein